MARLPRLQNLHGWQTALSVIESKAQGHGTRWVEKTTTTFLCGNKTVITNKAWHFYMQRMWHCRIIKRYLYNFFFSLEIWITINLIFLHVVWYCPIKRKEEIKKAFFWIFYAFDLYIFQQVCWLYWFSRNKDIVMTSRASIAEARLVITST